MSSLDRFNEYKEQYEDAIYVFTHENFGVNRIPLVDMLPKEWYDPTEDKERESYLDEWTGYLGHLYKTPAGCYGLRVQLKGELAYFKATLRD